MVHSLHDGDELGVVSLLPCPSMVIPTYSHLWPLMATYAGLWTDCVPFGGAAAALAPYYSIIGQLREASHHKSNWGLTI